MTISTVATWKDVLRVYDELGSSQDARWLCRGHSNTCWVLQSRLERALERFGLSQGEAPKYEPRLLREFKRHLHRYTDNCPDDDDSLRWFALMQHHGAPTRLLDFTYSFFVATFFALEAAKPSDRCALWAINHDWLWRVAKTRLPRETVELLDSDFTGGKTPPAVRALFETNQSVVIPLNPFHLDERLSVQQAVFLLTLDITSPFGVALTSMGNEAEYADNVRKIDVCCSKDFLYDALSELQRMNITRVSLFPGVDGLAQSLENLIAMPHRFLAEETWRMG